MQSKTDSELDAVAESYRLMLGLKTWPEQCKWAAELAKQHGMEPRGRRSGRTTMGLLYAIAKAVMQSIQTITVDARVDSNRRECINTAQALLRGIGLDRTIRVIPYRPDVELGESSVRYTDHANRAP